MMNKIKIINNCSAAALPAHQKKKEQEKYPSDRVTATCRRSNLERPSSNGFIKTIQPAGINR